MQVRGRNCLPFASTWVHPGLFCFGFLFLFLFFCFFLGGGSVLLICLVFCVVLLCVFMFWVPCCDVRCGFRMKRMFGSILPPVVCRRSHVLFKLFLFVCIWWCLIHIVLCLRLMLPVSLHGLSIFDCPFGCSLTFIWYACVSNKTKDEKIPQSCRNSWMI
jgi:hypothetical protein